MTAHCPNLRFPQHQVDEDFLLHVSHFSLQCPLRHHFPLLPVAILPLWIVLLFVNAAAYSLGSLLESEFPPPFLPHPNAWICWFACTQLYTNTPPHDFMLLRKCLFMFFCWKLNRTPCGRQLTGDCIKECIQMKGNRFAKIHYYTWRERTDRVLPMKQWLPPSHLRNFCAIPLELHASHTCVKNT